MNFSRRPCSVISFLLAVALAPRLPAQAQPDAKLALFHAVCDATLAFDAIAVTTKHRTTNPMLRGRAAVEAVVEVEVIKQGDLLCASANSGNDSIVSCGRKTIVRAGKGEYRYSRDKLADRSDMPYVFDADYVFAVLRVTKDIRVVQSEVGILNDKPIEILTLSANETAGWALDASGILPPCRGTKAGGAIITRGGGGPVSVTFDIALFFDPATKRLERARFKSYADYGQAGRLIAVQPGAGNVQVEVRDVEDEKPEADPAQPTQIEDGLPVRNGRQFHTTFVHSLDVTFRDHGTAKAPALDAAAEKMLRGPR